MLKEKDVIELRLGILEKALGGVIDGFGVIPRGRDLYQIMKSTAKYYHLRIMFSGYKYESQARIKMHKESTDQLMSTDLGSCLVRVLEEEEIARLLLLE